MTKKSIQKPENWQDFETLCKKLWGEIYEIPHEIKKNGRTGQAQHGVDVYGIPKGESEHVGIQCKGKDHYTHAALTEKEVDEEIEKAKTFKPKLGTLIFATTANKDAKIEEYVRLKNEESDFKILLYCWEDIADLIEENKKTYDWYVRDLMHQTKYDFRVVFNDFQETHTIRPVYEKKIIKYEYIEKMLEETINESRDLIKEIQESQKLKNLNIPQVNFTNPFRPEFINKSYVEFEIILENSGGMVLENWYFNMNFTSGVARLDDESGGILAGNFSLININKDDPRWVDSENKSISYNPKEKTVLVQGENRFFKVCVLPELGETEITFDWSLKARDFSKKGSETILIEPEYKIKNEKVEVVTPEEEMEEIEINYYRVKNEK